MFPLLLSQARGGRPERRDLVGQHFERLVVVIERLEADALERTLVAAASTVPPLASPHLAERTLAELDRHVIARGEAAGRDIYPDRVVDDVLQHAIGLHALEAEGTWHELHASDVVAFSWRSQTWGSSHRNSSFQGEFGKARLTHRFSYNSQYALPDLFSGIASRRLNVALLDLPLR